VAKLTCGARNLITDVPGFLVGNAADAKVKTGVTVLTAVNKFVAGVHVMGGAPGTRETDLLAPDKMVQQVDALVLSGGSALGLSAASGVADQLRAQGRGFDVGGQRVPIVPAAILFDLLNGGDKDWKENPYGWLGSQALAAAGADFSLGSEGAGCGATTADFKGGLGSASLVLENSVTVGALVAVNALGSALVDGGPHFWAAPFEMGDEFGGLGVATDFDTDAMPRRKGVAQNTTIAIVATDATLSQAQATRMAVAAHDGMARALWPSHTPMDGDLVFAAASGQGGGEADAELQLELGHAGAQCLARAIARGVYSATERTGDLQPAWAARFKK